MYGKYGKPEDIQLLNDLCETLKNGVIYKNKIQERIKQLTNKRKVAIKTGDVRLANKLLYQINELNRLLGE